MIRSKLPNASTTIFTKMSALAKKHNAINLGQGFPNFDGSPILMELVEKHLRSGKNQYAPMQGVLELRQALSNKNQLLYNVTLNPLDQILITAGATQAIFTILTAFIEQGDEVIIFEPAYDSYKPSIQINGGIVIPYEMEAPDYKINWAEVKRLISDKTKMIIINTPHNPTGSILSKDDMEALQNLVKGQNIIVLSDEVYEHLIFDGQIHQSVLSYPALFEQSICVFSFGKTFHNTGWKMGYCCGPKHLMEEVRKIHQWNVFSVNSFVQYAIAEFLQDENSYNALSSFYQEKRDAFNDYIEGSSLKPIQSKGTYFELFDYTSVSNLDDITFSEELVTKHGIASIPISVFYCSLKQANVIRFCFAKTNDVLEEAAKIIRKI